MAQIADSVSRAHDAEKLEFGHTSAPHSRADAERPGRHSHAERRNDQRDLKHADHAHACAQRYTRVLQRPRTVGGGLPAMASVQSLISRFRKSIASKPPPTGYAFSQILTFWPRFARLADLCITMSAEHGDDRVLKVYDRSYALRGNASQDAPRPLSISVERSLTPTQYSDKSARGCRPSHTFSKCASITAGGTLLTSGQCQCGAWSLSISLARTPSLNSG